MFLEFYGLREQPFGVTPDPRFIYFGAAHREALASMLYAIETRRGFSAMVAEPGMGKTSLLFHLLKSLEGTARTAFLFQTDGEAKELLRGLLSDLGIKTRGKGIAAMHDDLNKALIEEMRAGRKTVLVIDEAQNLDEKSLESVRLLSNFETPTDKLLHIILAGQPKLAERLVGADLVQLRQRVSTIVRLEPFRAEEIAHYIQFRLHAAGYEGQSLFSSEALEMIADASQGIPRNINGVCFQSLSLGFAMQKREIDGEILREVIRDLDYAPKGTDPQPSPPPIRTAERPEDLTIRNFSVASPAPQPPVQWPPIWRTPPLGAERAFAFESSGRRTRPWSATSKGIAALSVLAILAALLILLSDPGLQVSKTPAGQLSTQVVNAVLSSSDPNSDFLPAKPAALTPPSAPQIELTSAEPVDVSPGDLDINQKAAQVENAKHVDHGASVAPEKESSNRAKKQVAAVAKQEDSDGGGPSTDDNFQYHGPSRVQVQRRENIFQFALERFGRSNWTIVEQICELNPQVRGPYDMLAAGQWLQLPSQPGNVTSQSEPEPRSFASKR